VHPHDLLDLADHPALALLNSTGMGGAVEMLADGAGLLAWLDHTGLVPAGEVPADVRADEAGLDAAAREAVDLREWLRAELPAWVGGRTPAGAAGRLNALLARAPGHAELLIAADGGLDTRQVRSWSSPAALLAVPATAVAELLMDPAPDLVRPCDGAGCTLWFYDRTKSHRRRWCSMAVCGNRAKAAAHRQRQTA